MGYPYGLFCLDDDAEAVRREDCEEDSGSIRPQRIALAVIARFLRSQHAIAVDLGDRRPSIWATKL